MINKHEIVVYFVNQFATSDKITLEKWLYLESSFYSSESDSDSKQFVDKDKGREISACLGTSYKIFSPLWHQTKSLQISSNLYCDVYSHNP